MPTSEIQTPAHPFCTKLNAVLAASEFDRKAEALCSPYYAQRRCAPPAPCRGLRSGESAGAGDSERCGTAQRTRAGHRFQHHGCQCGHALHRAQRPPARTTTAMSSAFRKRGKTVERSFAHMLESGALRRTHLRGRENNEKRYIAQVCAFNLGLVMRRMCGSGTPRGRATNPSREYGMRGRALTLQVKYADFTRITGTQARWNW